jgi:hypothetical protein
VVSLGQSAAIGLRINSTAQGCHSIAKFKSCSVGDIQQNPFIISHLYLPAEVLIGTRDIYYSHPEDFSNLSALSRLSCKCVAKAGSKAGAKIQCCGKNVTHNTNIHQYKHTNTKRNSEKPKCKATM